MVNKYVKRCFTSCHQGDMQIKAMSQHSTSTPIQFISVQWLSRVQPHESQDARPPCPSPAPIRLTQTWNADGLSEQWGSASSLRGMQNGAATLEDSLAVSYKTLTIRSSKYTPWYLPKRIENSCLYKLLKDV